MINLLAVFLFTTNIYSLETIKVVSLDSIKAMSKECFKDIRPIKRYIVKSEDYFLNGKIQKKYREEKYFKILNNGEEKLIARKIVSTDSQEIKEIEVCSKYWTK